MRELQVFLCETEAEVSGVCGGSVTSVHLWTVLSEVYLTALSLLSHNSTDTKGFVFDAGQCFWSMVDCNIHEYGCLEAVVDCCVVSCCCSNGREVRPYSHRRYAVLRQGEVKPRHVFSNSVCDVVWCCVVGKL